MGKNSTDKKGELQGPIEDQREIFLHEYRTKKAPRETMNYGSKRKKRTKKRKKELKEERKRDIEISAKCENSKRVN